MAPISVCLLIACGGGSDGPAGPTGMGRALYEQPFDDGNTFTCATCHALSEPASDGLRRPGHPIGNATRRSSYKNGLFTNLLDAVNTCVTEWMRADALTETDERWIALEAFLESQATVDSEPAIEIQIVPAPANLEGGDPIAGMETFNGSCSVCHGMGAAGTMQAPSLIGEMLDRETIARRIRTSGSRASTTYPGLTGGRMPFWGQNRLSDDEMLDVVAYVEMIGEAVIDPDAGGGGMDAGVPDAASTGCVPDPSHPKVGQTAVLNGFSHDVAGTARIVDSCTIVIDNFVFDGGGINIQIYGGLGGDYDPPTGFSVSENLLGRVFGGESFTINLAEGDIDRLDGISVWCVPVGVSFGDGLFTE
ncbi:MAG: DM13 domain-containing protein [Myxococcota bacterium]